MIVSKRKYDKLKNHIEKEAEYEQLCYEFMNNKMYIRNFIKYRDCKQVRLSLIGDYKMSLDVELSEKDFWEELYNALYVSLSALRENNSFVKGGLKDEFR